jgi:hypothetical protein
MELQPLKIRLSTWNQEIINNFCTNYAVRWAYVLEHVNNENHHCHLYIETSSTEVSIRAYIRRTIGSGNHNYSMNKLDTLLPMEYLRYLCKQGEIVHNFLTEDQIEYYKNLDLQVKEEIKEKAEKRKKASSQSVLECLREIMNKYVAGEQQVEYQGKVYIYPQKKDADGYDECFSKEDVVQIVIDYYQQNKILVREFQMISQVQTLLLEFRPSYTFDLKNRILDKI